MLAVPTSTAEIPNLVLVLAGQRVHAMTCGALWWEEPGVLVVSDLHFEKGSSYAARGQMLPPYDTRDTLGRVGRLMTGLSPRTVISAGLPFLTLARSLEKLRFASVALIRFIAQSKSSELTTYWTGGQNSSREGFAALPTQHVTCPWPCR